MHKAQSTSGRLRNYFSLNQVTKQPMAVHYQSRPGDALAMQHRPQQRPTLVGQRPQQVPLPNPPQLVRVPYRYQPPSWTGARYPQPDNSASTFSHPLPAVIIKVPKSSSGNGFYASTSLVFGQDNLLTYQV